VIWVSSSTHRAFTLTIVAKNGLHQVDLHVCRIKVCSSLSKFFEDSYLCLGMNASSNGEPNDSPDRLVMQAHSFTNCPPHLEFTIEFIFAHQQEQQMQNPKFWDYFGRYPRVCSCSSTHLVIIHFLVSGFAILLISARRLLGLR
jgi:hypothetical protein